MTIRPLLFALALPLIALGKPAPPPPTPPPAATMDASSPAAIVGGKPITLGEIDQRAQRDLYDVRSKVLEDLITQRVLEAEAKRTSTSAKPTEASEFLRTTIEKRVPEVTEKEASDFYTKNKDRMPPKFQGKTFEELKRFIIDGLTQQKRQEAAGAFIEELRAKAGIKVLMLAPRIEVAATGPSLGPKDAKVTIVEFSDFQCPYCSKGKAVMDEVRKAYPTQVRVVFRDFPLAFHEHAGKAAEAGHCANEQGKFWAMHDWMFDHQDTLSVEELKAGARAQKLDGAKFDNCLATGRFAGAVALNLKAGEEAGVHGTPAFFVNGVFLDGALPFERFKTEIDRLLSQSSNP